MWEKVIIFILSFLSASAIVFSHYTIELTDINNENAIYEYSIDPNHDSDSELCLSFQPAENLHIHPAKIINNTESFNQTEKSVQKFKQAPLTLVVQKSFSDDNNGDYWLFDTVFLSVLFFLVILNGIGSVLFRYYRCKFIVSLGICIKKGIQPRRHTYQLISFLSVMLIDYTLLVWSSTYDFEYFKKLFKFYEIEKYTVFFKHHDISELCFAPQQLVNTLYTNVVEMKFNSTQIYNEISRDFDIIQQRKQIKLLVGGSSYTSTFITELFMAIFIAIIFRIFDFMMIKNASNDCRQLQRKIDFKDAVETEFTSKLVFKSEKISESEESNF